MYNLSGFSAIHKENVEFKPPVWSQPPFWNEASRHSKHPAAWAPRHAAALLLRSVPSWMVGQRWSWRHGHGERVSWLGCATPISNSQLTTLIVVINHPLGFLITMVIYGYIPTTYPAAHPAVSLVNPSYFRTKLYDFGAWELTMPAVADNDARLVFNNFWWLIVAHGYVPQLGSQ